MSPDELRRHIRGLGDWIADYLSDVESHRVLSSLRPGDVRRALSDRAPEEGEPFEAVLRDFERVVLPGITHWNHPSFFAWFAVTGSGPGILGELLSAALNVNAMVWRASPAGTELEEVTLDWLRRLLGLPDGLEAVINDTASSSSLYALAAARELGLPEAREKGLAVAPRARVYASEEAHSSVDKAALTLGLGREGVRRIGVDDAFRLRPDALRRAVEEDREQGIRPLAVVATVGTTATTSVDPVEAVVDVARDHDLWLHVDAAYGGAGAVLPELRPLFAGWERADSVVVNPHKWLFTPIDCSALYCRRPEALRRAFSLTPEYLSTREEDEARDLMDYGVSLGRRFRALKLWFVLRHFGVRGLRDRIRGHVALARRLGAEIDRCAAWERVAPVPFGTVVFRFAPSGVSAAAADELNRKILQRVNDAGEVFLSHAVLEDRFCLRVAVGNLRTRWRHVERAWTLLREAAEEVRKPG